MSIKPLIALAALAAITTPALAQITIPTVRIGNPGNAPDTTTISNFGTTGYGSVAYVYNIGTTEVTSGQYAAFLNAVAAADPHDVYTTDMAHPQFGCGITRSGSSGSYTYSVDPAFINRPASTVSFWSAARFANWLHNGQPTGVQNSSTTEDGAYTLTPTGIANNTVTRNAGATWALPSENEWYKAAYHQPAAQGGDIDNYWLYPTSSNTFTGNANYLNQIGTTTPVGSYSANFYGTYDMGGNVWEWNETIYSPFERGLRGGDHISDYWLMGADIVNLDYAEYGFSPYGNAYGFRVVQLPSPAAASLVAFAGLLTARRRRSSASSLNSHIMRQNP